MRLIIIITSLTLLCTRSVNAQDELDLLGYELEIFEAENDTLRNMLLLDKINWRLLQEDLDEAVLIDMDRVSADLLPAEKKLDFYWNAALTYYLLDRPNRALHQLDNYTEYSLELDTSFYLLEYLTYANYNTPKAEELYTDLVNMDSSFACVSCIMDVNGYHMKHKNFPVVMSYFIPGFGMMYTGKPVKAIVSIALNTLTVFTLIYTIQNQLWINTVSWGINLGSKFYFGNVRLTKRLVDEREQEKKKKLALKCEPHILYALEKYPVSYRTY